MLHKFIWIINDGTQRDQTWCETRDKITGDCRYQKWLTVRDVISKWPQVKTNLMWACFINGRQLIISVGEVAQSSQVMMQGHVWQGWQRGQRGCVQVSVVRKFLAWKWVAQRRHAWRVYALLFLPPRKNKINNFIISVSAILTLI